MKRTSAYKHIKTNDPELPPYQIYKRWQKKTGYSSMDRFGKISRKEMLKA